MVKPAILVVIFLIIFAAIGGIVYWMLYRIPSTHAAAIDPLEQRYLRERDFWLQKAIAEGEGTGKWYYSKLSGYLCSQHAQRGVFDTLEECEAAAEKAKPVVQLGDSCNQSVKCYQGLNCFDQLCKQPVMEGESCAGRYLKCVDGTICGSHGKCVKF